MDTEVLDQTAVVPHAVAAVVTQRDTVMAAELLSSHTPGIDVLRGVAVLMVITFHGMAYRAPGIDWGSRAANAVYSLTAWGWLGVNLFFVLSGFLITGILDDTVARPSYYKRFYIRRALRILPAYLAVLALAWATGFITPNYIALCLLFLANMPGLFLHHGYLFYGPLWSLAVEEQFYLVWPALYRGLQRRGMLILSLLLLIVCPILRALAFAHLLRTGDVLSKSWMVADNLAIGAVLAILLRWPGISRSSFARLGWVLFSIGSCVLIALFVSKQMAPQSILRNSIGLSCFQFVCAASVISMLCLFQARALPPVMKIFIFFGDISYGLYLIHLLLFQMWDRSFGIRFTADGKVLLLRFAVANGLAIILAVLSKRFFEDPILRLKSRLAAAR